MHIIPLNHSSLALPSLQQNPHSIRTISNTPTKIFIIIIISFF